MATAVSNAGLCTIKILIPGGSLETLGYTRNGAEPTEEAFFIDVPGDENGGDEGPPIEIQYMGQIARIRVELTKFDVAVLAKVRKRIHTATLGTPATAGTLMFAGTKDFRLLLHSPNDPRNFPRVICRGAIESNNGTKWQSWSMEFEAHKDANGVLENTTTT